YWKENGSDHEKVGAHDSAGIDLGAAKWLVEEQGAILIGSGTSGPGQLPPPTGEGNSIIPGHPYLLGEPSVHTGGFRLPAGPARGRVYEFCYVCSTNKIRGTAAGFCLRPMAIR